MENNADWLDANPALTVFIDTGYLNDATIDTGGFNAAITATITSSGGNGTLAKEGTGTLTLYGADTDLGATNINAGALLIDGTLGGYVDVEGAVALGEPASAWTPSKSPTAERWRWAAGRA